MKNLIVIASIATLAGCGGGGSSPPATALKGPSVPATAPPPARYTSANGHPLPLVVMLDGDSTQYGSHPGESCNGVPAQTCANPAALMQADFDILYGPGVVKVVLRAEPGSTIEDDLYGTGPYTNGPLASNLASVRPDVVSTNAEINDASYSTDPATYGTFLSTWIRTASSYGAIPVIEEPNPVCADADPATGVRASDMAYLQQIWAVGTQLNTPVLQVYKAFLAQPDWQTLLQADCVHPTDAGYEFKEGQFMTQLVRVTGPLIQ